MSRLTTLAFALLALSENCSAQQWWAPGACWVYDGDAIGVHRIHRYQYTNDTIIDGMQAQVALYTLTEQIPNGPTNTWISKEYISWQGNVILHRITWPFPPYQFLNDWDTLYVLGDVGDRWWPINADASCSPQGMLEIQSAGTTTIDGVDLDYWELAYLNIDGQPWLEPMFIPGDSLNVIARIGSRPRRPLFTSCLEDPWFDPEIIQLIHYSDNEISFPSGSGCDIATSLPDESTSAPMIAHPNPGTDHFSLNHNAPVIMAVRDVLGRIVQPEMRTAPSELVSTKGWPSGTYFIEVANERNEQQILRWVKQ